MTRFRPFRPVLPTSRRSFLRSAAVTLALPLLPSALPRAARGDGKSPVRLLYWFVPNGLQTSEFKPEHPGEGYDLKQILAPIAPVQEHVSVLSGLSQAAAEDSNPGDHARGTGSFLTCTPVRHTAGNDIENGISIDQVAAQARGDETLFPSLQIGIQTGGNTGDCTGGYSCAYTRNISWAGPATPLPAVTDPQVLFDRLFEGSDPAVSAREAARRTALRSSVLDQVLDEALTLHTQIGTEDREKLDEYMTGVRELEARIQSLGSGACAVGEAPPAGLSYPDEVRVATDLMVLALECDLTRIITFMLGEGGSNQTYNFIGVPGAHHQLSHHQRDPTVLADLYKVGAWEVEQFAYLIERMSQVSDGEGSLLDSTLVFFSSEIRDGDLHDHRDLPVLLAGKGGGAHTPGRHIDYDNLPIADLFIAMLHAFDVEIDRFGLDGTRPLDRLVS